MHPHHAFRPEIFGERFVEISMPVNLSFRYHPDFRGQPAPPRAELFERLRIGAVRPARPPGLGPHLMLVLAGARPVFQFRPGQVAAKDCGISVKLEQPLKEKKVKRWHARQVAAHFLQFRDPDGAVVQAVFYAEPVQVRSDTSKIVSEDRRCPQLAGADGSAGMVCSAWRVDTDDERVEHRNYPLLYHCIRRPERFPNAPHSRLDFTAARLLKAGDTFAAPLPEPAPLQPALDCELQQLGFEPNAEGNNCITDFCRYSLPLRRPDDRLWTLNPLPDVLAQIAGIRDTPEHSYGDLIAALCGQTVGLVELGHGGDSESAEPAGKQRTPRIGRAHDQPQPCYNGPRRSVDRIGRYLIFTIDWQGSEVFLVDSNWRDKEVALHLFGSHEDAVAYCRGSRDVPRLGRKPHREGWADEVPAWIEHCLTRRVAAPAVN